MWIERPNKKGIHMRKAVSYGVALLSFLLFGFAIYKLFGIPLTYSEGERAGVVYKISKQGYVIKTWEGDLNVGIVGEELSGPVTMKIWQFSVKDDETAKKIEEYARSGERITLHYKQPYVMGALYGKSEYLVIDVYAKAPQ